MNAHREAFGGMPGLCASLPVEVYQGPEMPVLASDDGNHQGKSEEARPREGVWCSAHTDPDRQFVLQGPGVHRLSGERGAVCAGPVDLGAVAELQEQFKLLLEERIVVLQLEAEEREGLGKGAASGDDLRPSPRKEVERCELLENPDRVCRAQDRDGAGEPDALGLRRRRRKDHGGSGIEKLAPVVFADAEDIESHLVGEPYLLEQVGQAVGRVNRGPGDRVPSRGRKAVDPELHVLN